MTLIACPECGTEVSDQAVTCVRCGYPINPQASAPPAPPRPTPHSVAISKFVILSLTTMTLYTAYWSYRNWWWVRQTRDRNVTPVLRAFFAPFTMFFLLQHLENEADDEQVPAHWRPATAAILFFGITVLWRLPDPWWLVSFLSFVPLIAPVMTANAVHSKVTGEPPRAYYSPFAIGVVLVGGFLLLMAVLGTFMPEVPEEIGPSVTT